MGVHVFPILNTPPNLLSIPSLWVIPVHQPQAFCILHRTWTGNSFLIWYYTCFNAILPNHPPLPLPQSPKDCSIHLCLFCCLAYRVVVTIFLNSIIFLSFSYLFIVVLLNLINCYWNYLKDFWKVLAGKDWGQEEKGTTKDEMVGQHHQLNGHEFE